MFELHTIFSELDYRVTSINVNATIGGVVKNGLIMNPIYINKCLDSQPSIWIDTEKIVIETKTKYF